MPITKLALLYIRNYPPRFLQSQGRAGLFVTCSYCTSFVINLSMFLFSELMSVEQKICSISDSGLRIIGALLPIFAYYCLFLSDLYSNLRVICCFLTQYVTWYVVVNTLSHAGTFCVEYVRIRPETMGREL